MNLFDEMERDDHGPGSYSELGYVYLNRSARSYAARVRETLETWFSRYPIADQEELRSRFRSDKHPSAFYELFVHELLIRLGCQVDVHPELVSTTRRPDFLVKSPTGSSFYLEAVLATNESDEEAAARARMNVVNDALNRLDSPNFFIGMDLSGAPRTPPSARKIRAELSKCLAQLDPDEVAAIIEAGGLEALPHWPYEHHGWRIEFFPIPKSPSARGKRGMGLIGTQMSEVRSLDSRTAIRDAIITKAKRYGDHQLPYIIAVNALEPGIDRIHAMEALFGKEQFVLVFTPSGPYNTKMERVPDGAWLGASGPRYTRVSAVLLVNHVLPRVIPRASICLYHNPWAKRPYKSVLNRLPQAILQDGRMEWQDGETLEMIFDLPPGWPWE